MNLHVASPAKRYLSRYRYGHVLRVSRGSVTLPDLLLFSIFFGTNGGKKCPFYIMDALPAPLRIPLKNTANGDCDRGRVFQSHFCDRRSNFRRNRDTLAGLAVKPTLVFSAVDIVLVVDSG